MPKTAKAVNDHRDLSNDNDKSRKVDHFESQQYSVSFGLGNFFINKLVFQNVFCFIFLFLLFLLFSGFLIPFYEILVDEISNKLIVEIFKKLEYSELHDQPKRNQPMVVFTEKAPRNKYEYFSFKRSSLDVVLNTCFKAISPWSLSVYSLFIFLHCRLYKKV